MSGQVLLERNIPLHWERITAEHAVPAAVFNPLALQLLDTLDETSPTQSESEAHSELTRIELKLNLVLQLLNQLLLSRRELPAAQTVRFASDGLAVPVDTTVQPGDQLSVSLYLDIHLPVPVALRGQVRTVEDNGWAWLDLASLNEEQQAIWSRWVFRQHRRAIAQHHKK